MYGGVFLIRSAISSDDFFLYEATPYAVVPTHSKAHYT